uniref:Uncharacterized protein n=2 Tax=Triticum urartu TaxID=4572 RepID=A0A8R7QCI5_TRIUA
MTLTIFSSIMDSLYSLKTSRSFPSEALIWLWSSLVEVMKLRLQLEDHVMFESKDIITFLRSFFILNEITSPTPLFIFYPQQNYEPNSKSSFATHLL